MTRKDIPNLISILRIVLVIPVAWLLLSTEYGLALLLFFIAGVSDGVDGYLAERNNWQSRLGSILDPLADKLLLVVCYLALVWQELLPVWLVVAILSRDIIIVLGAVIYHYKLGQYDMSPTLISKINTFMQIVLVFIIMLSLGVYKLDDRLIQLLIYCVLVTTLLSGLDYVSTWGKRAYLAMYNKNRKN